MWEQFTSEMICLCVYQMFISVLFYLQLCQQFICVLFCLQLCQQFISVLFCLQLCQQFINMTIEPQQLEYPVSVAQAIFESCIDSVDIQNELYCQLIKQTSPHPPSQHKPSLPVKVSRQGSTLSVVGVGHK